jgi:hypothetical protein
VPETIFPPRQQLDCLHVYCGKDDTITAFTEDGSENLKQIIADLRAGAALRRISGRRGVQADRVLASAGGVSISRATLEILQSGARATI